MSEKTRINPYLQNEVITSDITKLVSMCLEFAESNLKLAKEAIQEKKIDIRSLTLTKAFKAFCLLLGSLDTKAGGEVGENLATFYSWCMRKIMEVDKTNDTKVLDELINEVVGLKEAWRKAGNNRGGGGRHG